MKKIKKSLIMIVMLTAIVCLMSAFAFSASAAAVEKIEVGSWSQFRDALMNYNDNKPFEIKLMKNISREFDDYDDFDTDLLAIAGNKTLDLNGHTITAEVTIGEDNAQYLGGNHFPYLFSFYVSNSSLTIKDSSADMSGEICYKSYLGNAKKFICAPICDMFNVSRGDLTIEGGNFICGNERKDWVTAVYINGKLFTGNLRSQAYGTVFTVGNYASLTVNGGTFVGRGGSLVLDRTTGSDYRGAVIRKNSNNSSSVVINGGEFKGLGGANIFDCGKYEAKVNIKNGEFKTEGISNVLIRYNDIDAGTIPKGLMCIGGAIITEGIENKIFVNGGKTYMYTAGSKPGIFFGSSNDTKVGTFLELETQVPAIPTDRVTSLIDNKKLGESYAFTYKAKSLPEWMTDAGYVLIGELIVRDSANNIVAAKSGSNLQYNLSSISTVGTYSVQVKFSFIMGGKVVSTSEHTFIVEIIVPCTHTYSVISDTATCLNSGTKTERCTKCGDEKTSVSLPLGHLSLSSDWSYNSTHHWYYCRRCNTILTKDAHSFISSTNRTCKYCSYNDNCEWGNAMDTECDDKYHWWPCDTHSLDDPCPNNHQLEKELHTVCTLEEAGSLEHEPEIEYSCQNGYVCDGCGEYFGETGEHKWEQIPMREGGMKLATCITDGYIKYRCYYNGKYDCKGNMITCTATKTVTVPKLGHSFDYNTPESDTATCTADGVRSYNCTRSRCSAVVTKFSPQKCHSYSEWTVTTAPTCTKEGESTASCVYGCGHTEKMTLDALGHVFGTPETTVHPGCTTEGENTAKCTFDGCTETEKTVLDPLGHSYTDDNDMSCNECGFIRGLGIPASVTSTQTTNTITLSWSAVEGATGYRVFVSDSGWKQVVKATTATSCTLKNLTPGTKYTYAVRAYLIKDGTVTWAPKYAIFTTATQPALIKKVTSTKQTATSITISWDKVNCGGYRVFQYNPTTKRWDIAVKATRNTSATITGLTEGRNYIFAVRPYVNTGTEIIWAKAYTKVTTSTMLSKITLKALSSAKGRATIAWGKAAGATGYQVWYSTSPTSGYKKIANYTNNSTYQYNLTSGTTYYYRARAYKAIGGSYVYGAWSDVVSVIIK